jgi:hypothetical protein
MICNGLVAKIRADRKGSVGYATSSTIGGLYCILAMGYVDTSLFLAFGHATLRMIQMLRAVNYPLEVHQMTGALEHEIAPKQVSMGWYRLAWRLNRMNADVVLPQVLPVFQDIFSYKSLELSKASQYSLTILFVMLAGAPFSPLTNYNDQAIMELLHINPYPAVALMVLSVVISTSLFWILMAKVLDPKRFREPLRSSDTLCPSNNVRDSEVEALTQKVKAMEKALQQCISDQALVSPLSAARTEAREPLLPKNTSIGSVDESAIGA